MGWSAVVVVVTAVAAAAESGGHFVMTAAETGKTQHCSAEWAPDWTETRKIAVVPCSHQTQHLSELVEEAVEFAVFQKDLFQMPTPARIQFAEAAEILFAGVAGRPAVGRPTVGSPSAADRSRLVAVVGTASSAAVEDTVAGALSSLVPRVAQSSRKSQSSPSTSFQASALFEDGWELFWD